MIYVITHAENNLKKKEISLMTPLTKIDTIVESRWKENVSKDGEENLETREEKKRECEAKKS